MLAGAAFALSAAQDARQQAQENERAARDRAIAAGARQDEALQTYLQEMSDLILQNGLAKSRANAEVRSVAHSVTLTVLNRLDGRRKGLVLQFLAQAKLLRTTSSRGRRLGAS